MALFLLVELVCGVLGSDPAARWEAAMRHSLLAAGAAALPKLIDRVILSRRRARESEMRVRWYGRRGGVGALRIVEKTRTPLAAI